MQYSQGCGSAIGQRRWWRPLTYRWSWKCISVGQAARGQLNCENRISVSGIVLNCWILQNHLSRVNPKSKCTLETWTQLKFTKVRQKIDWLMLKGSERIWKQLCSGFPFCVIFNFVAQWIWRILLLPFSTSLCLRILWETSLFCFYPRIPRGRFCQLPFSIQIIQLFMWTLVHDMICAVLCAVGSGFWHCLFWRGYGCIGRTWIASATWGCGLNLCAWFSLPRRVSLHIVCRNYLIWLVVIPPRYFLDKTCEAHDDRKGYLDLLYIYIRIYNILLYYLGTVLSCYSACSAHLPSNKCFFPYSVSLSQELLAWHIPKSLILASTKTQPYYPYFILPVHGFVSVQAITKYCELHKLGEHRKPVFGNVWKQLLASLAWHSLTILANYLPIFT